jgi:hypothetical protein
MRHRNKNDRHYITRVDYDGDRSYDKAWYVRISFNGNYIVNRMFYDRTFGGNRKALAEAKTYRDVMLKLLKKPKDDLRILHSKISKRNKTGTLGVCLLKRYHPWSKNPFYYYQASYYKEKNGIKGSASYSCQKYGEEEAFNMALDFRNTGIKQIMQERNKVIKVLEG